MFTARKKAVESYYRVTSLNLNNQEHYLDGLYAALLWKGHHSALCTSKEIRMECYICKGPVIFIKTTGDYEHLSCSSCGEYEISGTAVVMSNSKSLRTENVLQKINEASASEEIYQISRMDFS